MNNKGVTLIELLIVIVVLGIISAFAIPAVGTIIENTEKDAILADAIAIENAAKLYCAQTTCTSSQTLDWDDLSAYVSSFDDDYYEETDPLDTAAIATLSGGEWQVTLERNGTGTAATDEWEWVAAVTPSAGSRANVTDDDN
jgi:type IV pilus assembly protein PilA